jgi:peroxiredoxin Q/BCP
MAAATVTLSALSSASGKRRWCCLFYPRDDTSGCTKEAIAFTGLAAEFEAAWRRR